MDRPISRRQILSAVGVTGVGGLSGCSWVSGTHTELAGVEVLNPYYGTERIVIRIKQADETVLEETVAVVQTEGAETIACSWDRRGDPPIVEARLANDGDWQQLDVAEIDEDKALVQAIVRPESGVRFIVTGANDDYFVDVCAQEE